MTRRGAVVSLSLALLLSMIVIVVDTNQPIKAIVITVNDDGGADYTSIQDAVIAANPGDTIFVYNGTYYENVVITKRLNLTGEDMETTIIDSKGVGNVVHVMSDWVNISGFEIKNSSSVGSAIYLQSSDYCKIDYCYVRYSNYGIYLDNSDYCSLKYCLASSNDYGIYLDALSNNNILVNNSVWGSFGDIYLDSSSNNILINNSYEVQLHASSNNTITNNMGYVKLYSSNGNKIENCDTFMIYLQYSSDNIIRNNTRGYRTRIILQYSDNNTIENNNFNRSNHGIYFEYSSNNKVFSNWCNLNDYSGISISGSNNLIKNNICNYNDIAGISVVGAFNIVENNTCNWNGISDGIGLGSSWGSVVKNNTCLSNGRNGISVSSGKYPSYNNVIDNNICLDNENGIYLSLLNTSIVRNNDCFSSNENGIYLVDVTNSTIGKNIISNNYRGILSDSSENNTIRDNILWSNILFGVSQESSSDNSMYHNHFIDNTIQAYDDGVNSWNQTYPIGGNYWTDFNDPNEGAYDDYLDVYQDFAGSDGIVDNGIAGGGGQNPYIIDGDSQDDYPLINPFGNFTVLYEGWNLVSIPFIQTESDLKTVLESISGSYDSIQWYNASDPSDHWKHHNSAKSTHMNDLNDIDHTMGFMIHITEPGGVLFDFPGSPLTQNQTIPLHPGWNMVGYPSLKSLNRTNGLNNLTLGIEVDAIWIYGADTQKWYEMGENDYFEPGRGYWIHATTQCEWEVPL